MRPGRHSLTVGVAVVCALAGTGAATAASPRPPMASAPSEYVEVVPTAGGGGVPAGRSSPTAENPSAPSSPFGAAAEAVASADPLGAVALGGAMVATAGLLAAAALRRRSG